VLRPERRETGKTRCSINFQAANQPVFKVAEYDFWSLREALTVMAKVVAYRFRVILLFAVNPAAQGRRG
jgi:hypothetical protein